MQRRDWRAWEVISDAADAEAYAVLRRNPVWNSFAIADLAPPFRAWTTIALAREVASERAASCLVLQQPGLTVVSPDGPEPGVAAIFETIDLPERALVQARPEHLPPIERYYQPDAAWREMLRMAVTPARFQPPAPSHATVERLGIEDLSAVLDLYARYPENHFRTDLLRDGVFFGVRDGRCLVAIGGTHVVAPSHGIAVLGGIFTHPDARRRGLATAITARLVEDLFARGCSTVVLNVTASNDQAIRVYERLGFDRSYRYLTGLARLRAR